jgi:hypothetical protein
MPKSTTKWPLERGVPRKGKGLIRSVNRQATRDEKAHPGEARKGRLREPSACERRGAIFRRRTWRRDGHVTLAMLDRADWTVCPACEQIGNTEGRGRILVTGQFAVAHEPEIRARIRNVAARAAFTQPQRRVVSAERQGNVLEVLTTSQKLAHRIVHELKKVFRGTAAHHWSDDGTLLATWQRER